ncbi:tetratricopeptide repeat-containing sensor histidine kinase [Ekhidna sp.]|uniref:tetratricopeptide repeat-containing sensor histidine kinase n=1 Tax=Ekhidna sp. TaxID=2608089 RepID=UPI00329962A1
MKKVITIIAIQFITLNAFAQSSKLDSLLILLPQTAEEDRITLLHEIVKSAWTSNPTLVIPFGREAIRLSEEQQNQRLLSISYRIFGGLYNYMSEIDSGKYYKLKALQIAQKLQDSILLASSYNNLGVTEQTVGNYVEALNYYYQAYLIVKQLFDYPSYPVILANLSEIYYDLAEYDSAVFYANMAVDITSLQPNTSRHLLTLNALARSKLAQNELDFAQKHYTTIINISRKIGDKRYAAYANQGLGKLYTTLEASGYARLHLARAHALFSELDDKAYLAEINMDLGNLKMYEEPDSAYYFIRKSLSISNELGLKDLLIDNYKLLITHFGTQRNFDSLQYYLAVYQELQSIKRKENNLLSIQGMFAKMKDEHIREQLNSQSIELEQKTFETNFFVAFTVLTILFAGLIYRYYRKQKMLGIYLTEVNEQITNQNELIDNKNKKLRALNSEKNDLINIVAHDLKNPLSNIISSVQLIKDSDRKKSDVPLEIIEGSAIRLSNMITKILDVEAIEKGLTNLKLVPVNLSDILSDICDDLDNQAFAKNIKLHRDLSSGIIVLGDKTYIYQVLENIVSNAIKYSPFEKNIHVVLKSYNRLAKVEVKDEGPGISDKEQTQLFQMYQKLSATPTADEHSSGLGLSIAKKYVDAMYGKIWCKSKLEQGTSFYVQLKLA